MQVVESEAFMPTIVRRVHEGKVQTLERKVDGRPALCVFWSEEHARREMVVAKCGYEEGWKPIERDHEEMALVFEVLPDIELVSLEPCPEDEKLWAIIEPERFITFLEMSLEE